MARNNHIYVDYENVREADLSRLAGRTAHVTLVLGKNQKALPVALVKLIQEHATQVSLVETELVGRNALDFVLACELGRQSQLDSSGYFHILSKDKGFDALILYLKGKGILAARRESFCEIPALMNHEERLALISLRYREKLTSRPAKRKTLETSIHAAFAKELSAKEVGDIIAGLERAKVIEFTEGDRVRYPE